MMSDLSIVCVSSVLFFFLDQRRWCDVWCVVRRRGREREGGAKGEGREIEKEGWMSLSFFV